MPSPSRSRSLPLLAALTVLSTASGAAAQALDVETLIDEDRIDGCSQSTAHTHTESVLHLEVTGTGVATLALDTTSRSAFRSLTVGPSGVLQSSGQVTGSHERDVWTGRAVTAADGTLHLRFDEVKTVAANWRGYGTLPLPAPRTEQADLELTCAPVQLDVYPAPSPGQAPHEAGAGERATPTAGYRCTLTRGPVFLLSRLGSIPFAKTAPVTRHVSDLFGGEHGLIRRR